MTTVRVQAPGRLHFGLIDLRGDLGRRYGGIGAAVAEPRLRIRVTCGGEERGEGPAAERAQEFARRFLRHHGITAQVAVHVEDTIPPHVGLGSGTQLGLAVARGLAVHFGIDANAAALARAVGRTQRSAVGTWLFERGGLVVEGGRRSEGSPSAPLLFRRPLPPEWRCVIAIPRVPRGLSGRAEETAFRRLAPPSPESVAAIAHLILMGVLPSLIEEDLPRFGAALTDLQRRVGDCFRELQGGRFAHPEVADLIEQLERSGAHGVGQSSWGPAVFALAAGDEQARQLADLAQDRLGPNGRVFATRFHNEGARYEVTGAQGEG